MLLAVALALVQFASDTILARAGSPNSLPRLLPRGAGVAVYRTIERVAPASYVEAMLARAALESGDLPQARAYAQRLPNSQSRSEILGTVAQAQGDERSAQRYFVDALDYAKVQNEVHRLFPVDFDAAYALERQLQRRLKATATHPDALAESYWELGQLANARWLASNSPEWAAAAMRYDRNAVALAPLSGKYWIAAGTQSYLMRDYAAARSSFERGADVDPTSADAFAGLAIVAQAQHQPAAAAAYAARSRALGRSTLLPPYRR